MKQYLIIAKLMKVAIFEKKSGESNKPATFSTLLTTLSTGQPADLKL